MQERRFVKCWWHIDGKHLASCAEIPSKFYWTLFSNVEKTQRKLHECVSRVCNKCRGGYYLPEYRGRVLFSNRLLPSVEARVPRQTPPERRLPRCSGKHRARSRKQLTSGFFLQNKTRLALKTAIAPHRPRWNDTRISYGVIVFLFWNETCRRFRFSQTRLGFESFLKLYACVKVEAADTRQHRGCERVRSENDKPLLCYEKQTNKQQTLRQQRKRFNVAKRFPEIGL